MSRQMVQYNTSHASKNPEARPLSKLEVFRKLGITTTNRAVPTVKESALKVEPQAAEPVKPEAALETASDTAPVEENPSAAEEEKITASVSELHLKKNYASVLTANGIETIEDLTAYITSGKDLTELSGIGAAAASSIIEKFEAWQNEQNQMK